jgi:hypothetical protein
MNGRGAAGFESGDSGGFRICTSVSVSVKEAGFSGGPVRSAATTCTRKGNQQVQTPAGTDRGLHGLYVISAAFVVFAGVAAAMALPYFWSQYRVVSGWPEVNAQVVRSDVVQLTFAGSSYYAWDSQFLFARDGQPHFAGAGPHNSRDYQQLRRLGDEYPVGSYHRVRFNPSNPQEIRLHAGWNRRFFAISILLGSAAAGFGAIGLALFLLARAQSASSP